MKLSVALCTYNGEKFIKEQLESILNQTKAVDEIIICDDKSNDKTIQIIEEIKSKFPNKLSVYINEVNLGSNKNFEKAISICSGDYIFLSDQDDIWKNDKVEKTLKCFEDNPSLEVIFSNANLINEKGENFTKKNLWDSIFFLEKKLQKPIDLFRLITSKRNMVTGATLCFKKEIKGFILPIPAIKGFYHDEWIAVLIASRKKIDYIDEELISYRIHSGQQMGANGFQNKNRSEKHLKFCNFILEITKPKSYQDFKTLTKIHFRNYLKFQKIADSIDENFNFLFYKIATHNLELYKEYKDLSKKANPILHFFEKTIDKIRGKRQY